jgi:hypothetical protein
VKEDPMESKIRIKLGPIEVEYEGSEVFLKEELPNLIRIVSELYKTSNIPPNDSIENGPSGGAGKIQLSTGSIAAKLSCSSGPDLLLAAAAHFTFSKEKESFTRQQLLSEIKTAKAYFKKSYTANLTSLLNGLVKGGKLNEPVAGTFALTADTIKDLEARLAN